MRDPSDDDDIDRAYRAAVASQTDAGADATRRRRLAVLQAVRGLDARAAQPAEAAAPVPAPTRLPGRPAANQARFGGAGAAWRGAMAACLIASTALVVVHLRDEPGAAVAPEAATPVAASPPAQPEAQAAAPGPMPAPAPVLMLPPVPAPKARTPWPAARTADTADRAPVRAAPAAVAPQAAAPPPASTVPPLPAPPNAPTITITQMLKAPAMAESSRGAAPDSTGTGQGLLEAVARGDQEAAALALGQGPPDAVRDGYGRTALALAVLRGDVSMARWLLTRGAMPGVADRSGQTPLGYAQASGDPAMLRALGKP